MGKYAKTALLIAGFAWSVAFGGNHWYVDAVNGDDRWDGKVAFSAVDQNANAGPKKTFANLFADCQIQSDDVVHAAAGTYSNLTMTATSGSYQGNYRVIVPAGVTLIADEGAEKTVIKGAAADGVSVNEAPFGCGEGAIRCVRLAGAGATIRGFTLSDGHSTAFNGSTYVGAVCGLDSATYVVDCIITNNVGGRGAGVYKSTAIRCFFEDNRASTTGCDILEGKAFNCVFGNLRNEDTYNVYGGVQYAYVNNVFYGTGYCTHAPKGAVRILYNSVVLKNATGVNTYYTNCVVHASTGTKGGGTVSITSDEDAKLDASWRPLRDSPCVDAGADWYDNFPTDMIDDKDLDFLKKVRKVGKSIDIGICESPYTAGEKVDWYVNANKGSDSNDGMAASTAYQTLAMATTNINLKSGDTVHVASGVYSNGFVTVDARRFRAILPEGVTLLGDGAESTIIEGAYDHANGTAESYWCGEDAVSCVRLSRGSVIRGFTLTRGRSSAFNKDKWGGAVYASGIEYAAYVVDCVLTNNFAGRGAGLCGCTAIRCRFESNGASTSGTDIFQGRAWNCIFGDVMKTTEGNTDDNVYQGGPYVNCMFKGIGHASWQSGSDYFTNIWNSVVLKSAGRNVKLVASVTTRAESMLGEGTVLLSEEEMMLDGNYMPIKGSPLIDSGRNDLYYAFPEDVASALAESDLAGGQRIYNGNIDIGAFEYDWRSDFAKRLKGSQISVVSASEGVAMSGDDALSVPMDASVEIVWVVKRNGVHSFCVDGDGGGIVSVLIDGETVPPSAEGMYSFIGESGTARQIVVSCADGGSAVLTKFHDFNGFVISVQ